ncbi:hypothetical protein [Methanolacinia petrolearia]|uniref:hypothetical protein n=1 Tax=Methanolacinia petrolearia TaxID=54120 RepID=UPI003BAC530F
MKFSWKYCAISLLSKSSNNLGWRTFAVQAIPIILFTPGGLSNQQNAVVGIR